MHTAQSPAYRQTQGITHSDLKNVFFNLVDFSSTTFMHTVELLRGKKLKTWFLCKLLETGTCMMLLLSRKILFQKNQTLSRFLFTKRLFSEKQIWYATETASQHKPVNMQMWVLFRHQRGSFCDSFKFMQVTTNELFRCIIHAMMSLLVPLISSPVAISFSLPPIRFWTRHWP